MKKLEMMKTKYCANCMIQNHPWFIFCQGCGRTLGDADLLAAADGPLTRGQVIALLIACVIVISLTVI